MYHFPSENNKELDQLQRQLRDEEASHDNTREELKEEKASHQKVKDELTDTKKRTGDKLAGKSHWKYDIIQSCTHIFTLFLFVYLASLYEKFYIKYSMKFLEIRYIILMKSALHHQSQGWCYSSLASGELNVCLSRGQAIEVKFSLNHAISFT